eukprot:5554478-Amphidinium_carterae.1
MLLAETWNLKELERNQHPVLIESPSCVHTASATTKPSKNVLPFLTFSAILSHRQMVACTMYSCILRNA